MWERAVIVSRYRLRLWQARATTLLLKARELQSEMLEALGPEHALTDFGDNSVMAAEDLAGALDRQRHLT